MYKLSAKQTAESHENWTNFSVFSFNSQVPLEGRIISKQWFGVKGLQNTLY